MTTIIVVGVVIALVVGAVTTPWVMLSRAKDEREAARVLSSTTAGELVRTKDALNRATNDLTTEQARSDALDDELAKTYDHPDPVGARERVLAKWKLEHDASRGRAVSVPAPATTAKPGPDGLLDPFAEG